MSLVNDMLRDLDQRRKDSEHGVSSVSLTPASELLKESGRQYAWFLVGLALLIACGAVAYFWLERSGSETVRSLDIRLPVATETAPNPSPAAPQAAPELASPAPSALAQAVPAERETAAVNTAAAEPAATAAPATSDGAPAVTPPVAEVPVATARTEEAPPAPVVMTERTVSAPDEGVRASAGTGLAQSAPQQQPPSYAPAPASPPKPEPVTTLDKTPATAAAEPALVDLSEGLAEGTLDSVKNTARRTPDELDTLAVQEALVYMSENNTNAAFKRLKQEIIKNRYAHQSRETYAKLLMRDGDAASAMQLVNDGLGLAPNHAGFKKVKARLLMAAGDVAEAADLLVRRAPALSEDIEYHEILATAQLANRDYEGARLSYSALVQQDRSQGKWWYGFAASHDYLGNWSAAGQAYSQAIQSADLSPNLRRRSQDRLVQLNR